MLVDLHVHTTASDGTYTPYEVVEYAKARGLCAVGITDHDTVAGIREAQEAGGALGVEVVPGVEINTEYKGFEVHILGYYINYADDSLLELLEHLRNMRFLRVRKMFQKLIKHGLKLSFDDVVKDETTESIGRPHLACAIVRAGYASSPSEAFSKFLVRGTPGWVKRYEFSPVQAIEAIETAKGVPVLAHPGLVGNDGLIRQLVPAGLKGLEAFHSEHTPEATEHYEKFAKKLGLLITGGSDFHGRTVEGRGDIGGVVVPYDLLRELKNARIDQ